MPTFTPLEASSVLIGRARGAAEDRAEYGEALRASDAGKIELARTDNATRAKRLLSEAAKEAGIKVRSSWEDKTKRILLWKKVGL